jgi:ABC-type xylose transport system permease subunit
LPKLFRDRELFTNLGQLVQAVVGIIAVCATSIGVYIAAYNAFGRPSSTSGPAGDAMPLTWTHVLVFALVGLVLAIWNLTLTVRLRKATKDAGNNQNAAVIRDGIAGTLEKENGRLRKERDDLFKKLEACKVKAKRRNLVP